MVNDKEIESYAKFIRDRRLELPAKLLLESHLPLASVFENFTHFVGPVVTPILGVDKLQKLTELLQDRKQLAKLVAML